MSVPESAYTCWWIASLIRFLTSTLSDITVIPGPLLHVPESLPQVVVQEIARAVRPYAGGRLSTTSNEQGVSIEMTCAVLVYAPEQPWQRGTESVMDCLTMALAAGSVPLISEAEAGSPIQHGSLLTRWDMQHPLPTIQQASVQIPTGPWQVLQGRLILSGQSSWIEGGG